MQRSRLGCLSGTGILAALVTALVIAGYATARGGLMFNPGPLSTQGVRTLGGVSSHAATGGECKTCHVAPWASATMSDRCIACHTDIAQEMRDAVSLHGTLMRDDPTLSCRHCHPEHRGPNAPLTMMEDLSAFPHETLGFSLLGHQHIAASEPFQCSNCHHGDITTFAIETCETCHRQIDVRFMDAHAAAFGTACLDCHDGVDRFDETFDHNVFSFKITGKHIGLACEQCHVDARSLGDFETTPQDCYSCHQDDEPHEGRFGFNCADCHNTSDWSDASFDHNLSRFPLTGAHVNVACESCHTGGQFQGLSAACVACHVEPAFHLGVLGTDCAACHNTTDWSPARFDQPHAFPLLHGGGATCATCHVPNVMTYTCYGCHEHSEAEVREEHLDEGINNFQNCMECHPDGQEHEGNGGDDDN